MTGTDLAAEAIRQLNGETIYYNAAKRAALGGSSNAPCADCQGFMERVAKNVGASMSYAGSNDMFRNACTKVVTLAEAKKSGLLQKGVALFILEHDGNEPAKYKNDGIGNASHVGMYIGEKAYYDTEKKRWCDVAHSSASRGKVCGSTTANGWTHVGLWKCANFSVDNTQSNNENGGTAMAKAYVTAESGSTVNLRKSMDTSSERVAKVPVGAEVEAARVTDDWARVEWNNYSGYMMTKFLASSSGEEEASNPTGSETPSTNGIPVVNTDMVYRSDVETVLAQANQLVAALQSILNSKG